MSDSDCSSEQVACAAIGPGCTLGLVIQVSNGLFDTDIDVVFLHRASCDIMSKYEEMVEILLMLQVFFAEDPEIECLFYGSPSRSETSLLFCSDPFCLWRESV